MGSDQTLQEAKTRLPHVLRPTQCRCGSKDCREANRITRNDGTISVMYECVDCGEYRL